MKVVRYRRQLRPNGRQLPRWVQSTIEELGNMSKASTLGEVVALLREKKAWWLVPMVTVFLLVGVLLVATSGSALSPFIYALF